MWWIFGVCVDALSDVVVIGSGIGGLSCASVLSAAEREVVVCEAHEHAGGAAHEWSRGGFHFESGPSLYAGLSPDRSPNPLKHVFQIIDEEPEWLTYDRWGTALPEGKFAAAVGAADFVERILPLYGGPDAVEQWQRLMRRVEPLGTAIFGLPSAAVREDAFAALTLGKFAGPLARVLMQGDLSAPFSRVLDECRVTDPFIRNWIDMICFLLQGATTDEAPTTLMAYMLSDFYRDGVALDYPKGGTKSIVDALVRGVTKHGGQVRTRSRVQRVLVENGRACGVQLKNGDVLRAKHVVCNADPWTTRALVPELTEYLDKQLSRVEPCASFLHLHLGLDGTDFPDDIPPQWAVVDDWRRGVDAPRNLVLVSVPSLLDPSLAPDGHHTLHAYVPATEPFADWENVADYARQKDEAAQVLWRAVEQYIPDVRDRVKLQFAATPRTHERFLSRHRGTYGAYLPASKGELLMGHKTPLPNFWMCGDSTFPGIGVPAVAASGLITANSILSPSEHLALLDKIRLP